MLWTRDFLRCLQKSWHSYGRSPTRMVALRFALHVASPESFCVMLALYAHRKGLGRGFIQVHAAAAEALKTPLQQAEQAGIPVAQHEQK